jgi:hypothetical protein
MNFEKKNLLAGILLYGAMQFIAGRMAKTGLGTCKVLWFEFMGFLKPAAEIPDCVKFWWEHPVNDCPGAGRMAEAMMANIRLDYFFIPAYVFAISFFGLAAAGKGRIEQAKKIVLLMLAAGLCDVVENLQIMRVLDLDFGHRPVVMSVFATAKFLLLATSVGWLLKLFFTKESKAHL